MKNYMNFVTLNFNSIVLNFKIFINSYYDFINNSDDATTDDYYFYFLAKLNYDYLFNSKLNTLEPNTLDVSSTFSDNVAKKTQFKSNDSHFIKNEHVECITELVEGDYRDAIKNELSEYEWTCFVKKVPESILDEFKDANKIGNTFRKVHTIPKPSEEDISDFLETLVEINGNRKLLFTSVVKIMYRTSETEDPIAKIIIYKDESNIETNSKTRIVQNIKIAYEVPYDFKKAPFKETKAKQCIDYYYSDDVRISYLHKKKFIQVEIENPHKYSTESIKNYANYIITECLNKIESNEVSEDS